MTLIFKTSEAPVLFAPFATALVESEHLSSSSTEMMACTLLEVLQIASWRSG